MSTAWTYLKTTFQEWRDDNASRLAAALSYYSAIAIAPLLVLAITVASWFFDTDTAREQLASQIQQVMGPHGSEALVMVLENADRSQTAGIAGILGLAVLIWGATNVFAQLQNALNEVWDVELKPSVGIWFTIRERILSLGLVLALGFLLVISLVLSAGIALLSDSFSQALPGADWIWMVLNQVASFVVVALLFAMIYKYLPDVEIAWRDVMWGAAVTALLFTVGKFLLGLYLGRQATDSAYGAAGSLVVFLIWVYFSAQIFFFGAEFTQVHARRQGRGLAAAPHARVVDDVTRPDMPQSEQP